MDGEANRDTLPSELLDTVEERLFDLLDKNKDGSVSMDELQSMIQDHHKAVTPARLIRITVTEWRVNITFSKTFLSRGFLLQGEVITQPLVLEYSFICNKYMKVVIPSTGPRSKKMFFSTPRSE